MHRDKSAKVIPDSEIDFSDIPEFSKKQLAKAKPLGHPRITHEKKVIAVSLPRKLIYDLQKLAKKKHKPYETLLSELLQDAIKRAA